MCGGNSEGAEESVTGGCRVSVQQGSRTNIRSSQRRPFQAFAVAKGAVQSLHSRRWERRGRMIRRDSSGKRSLMLPLLWQDNPLLLLQRLVRQVRLQLLLPPHYFGNANWERRMVPQRCGGDDECCLTAQRRIGHGRELNS